MFTKEERDVNTFSLAMSNTGSSPVTGFRMFRKNGGDAGPLVLENVAVFRSGTFRNSWGEQTTWTDFHIQSMVSNYDFLKSSKTFEDVPVRAAHPEPWFRNSTEEVIGYVSSLRAEKLAHPGSGEMFTYLIAGYEILDENAAAKVEKGLFKNRSAEVGMYSDNNDSEFFPVLTGFAYVDIPAVEGLNFGKRMNVRKFAMETEGNEMPPEADETEENVEEEWAEGTPGENVEEGGAEVAPDENADSEDDSEGDEGEETADEGRIVAVSGGTDNFSNGSASPTLSVNFNGKTITGSDAIQALMDSLSGAVVQDRAAYVKSMFSKGQILAVQKDKADEFVTSLSVDQFSAFREIFDEVPVNQTVAFRSGQDEALPVAKDAAADVTSEVAAHLRNALGEERFRATPFYQKNFAEKDGK